MKKLIASKNRLSQVLERLKTNIDRLINDNSHNIDHNNVVHQLEQQNKKLQQDLEKFKINNQEIAKELAETINQLDIYISQNDASN